MTSESEREDLVVERLARLSFRLQWLGIGFLFANSLTEFILPESLYWIGIVLTAMSVVVIFASAAKITEADAAAYPRHHRDIQSGRWRGALVAILFLAMMGAKAIALLPFPPAIASWQLWYGLAMLLLAPAALVIGPKAEFEEEITRALRARALRLGYATLVVVLVLVIAAAALAPTHLMAALAWGLFAGIAVPILAYVVFDWLSDRGETP
jgi:hypothetical protein